MRSPPIALAAMFVGGTIVCSTTGELNSAAYQAANCMADVLNGASSPGRAHVEIVRAERRGSIPVLVYNYTVVFVVPFTHSNLDSN